MTLSNPKFDCRPIEMCMFQNDDKLDLIQAVIDTFIGTDKFLPRMTINS